jgi:hypothetical protein
MSLFHLDTVFKCHRCATVRENLNRDTAHVCGCRNSGPMWREVRRVPDSLSARGVADGQDLETVSAALLDVWLV